MRDNWRASPLEAFEAVERPTAHPLPERLAVLLEQVAVDQVDHPRVAVTEDLGEHPRVGALGDQERCCGVAQVVRRQGSEPRGGTAGP